MTLLRAVRSAKIDESFTSQLHYNEPSDDQFSHPASVDAGLSVCRCIVPDTSVCLGSNK